MAKVSHPGKGFFAFPDLFIIEIFQTAKQVPYK